MHTTIQTPTPNLNKSISFYERLKFKKYESEGKTFVSDGKAHIEINPDKFARAGIKLYKGNWNTELDKLNSLAKVHEIDNGHLISDPSNCYIYLMNGAAPYNFETGECFSTLGNFAGLSLETTDIQKSIELWSIFGFEHTMGSEEQGWLAFKNKDDFGLSFMSPNSCPHMFFNPSMTYFNGGKNLPVIEKIKEADIEITEGITHFNKDGIVDNVIIRDPGGYGFFIFND